MKYLRTVSTRRLLAMIAGVVAVIAAGTAIAVAAGGSGPKPRAESLARAVRGALAAPPVKGISARISFTNHLIGSTNLQGSDPILSGATGRLWISNDGRMRLELQSDNGQDAQVLVSNKSFWIYDPSSNTEYRGTLPAEHGKQKSGSDKIPSIAQIQRQISGLVQHANLSGAIPSDVAGQAAYTVRVSPKHDGGLLGSAELAWDAARGVPLKFAIFARGQSSPVIQLKVTNISFDKVPDSDFAVSPPSGAKVVTINVPAGAAAGHAAKHGRAHRDVTGAAAVAKKVPFTLTAPKTLVGLPRRSVSLMDWNGTPAALVTYGQNLGGIAVIEQAAKPGATPQAPSGGDHQGLSLPSVTIHGATGRELATALGTVLQFSRGGVDYIVVGSVPAAAAEAAARGL
ncbi:MAG: LolA family protein [Solirubrobacteraceae bacterium]